MTQHPVGQGGMYSGVLESDRHNVHWVYDCGSNQRDALRREISSVGSDGHVDLLFLSHLDSDHINGVDQLLSAVETREVVLPLLGPHQKAVALVLDAADDRLTGDFVDFVENPAGWLAVRGVQRVTFVDGGDDDTPPPAEEGPVLPREGEPPADKAAKGQWTIPPEPVGSRAIEEVRKVAQGSAFATTPDSYNFDWIFAPYAHRPTKRRFAAFQRQIERTFGSSFSQREVIDAARSPGGREKLRSCYDNIWKDHNLVSMALYAGPITSPSWPTEIRRTYPSGSVFGYGSRTKELGWLASGDFQLRGQQRRQRYLSYYKGLLPRVDAFVLPHHGAAGNFDPSVLGDMPNLSVGIAPAGSDGRYGHPSVGVAEAVERHGAAFEHVSEHNYSLLRIAAW